MTICFVVLMQPVLLLALAHPLKVAQHLSI